MDRREVYCILNCCLEKCENFMQELDSAFKETEDWTESLRNDVKRLMNKETEIGLIMPLTPAACPKLGRRRLSVIDECDAVENGENSQPENEKPINHWVTSKSQEALLLSSYNKEDANESKEVSQRNQKCEKSLPVSESVHKAKISNLKRSEDEPQVSDFTQDEQVQTSQTQRSKRKYSSRERCSKHKEAELAEGTAPNVPQLTQPKKDGRLTGSKYSNRKNRCTRSLRQTRSTHVVDNKSSSSENNNSGEAMFESDVEEVPKKRSKRTCKTDKSTVLEASNEQSSDDPYEETSTKRKGSCFTKESTRATSKSHCKKISQDGKITELGSDKSLYSSSSGNENDQSSTEKNTNEVLEKNKKIEEINVKDEPHSDIQSTMLPSSLDDNSGERKSFIIRATLEICKRIENEPCCERNTMNVDGSTEIHCLDISEPCVSDSPIVNDTNYVEEHKCSKQRDISKKKGMRGTNSKLIDSPRSTRKVAVEIDQDQNLGNVEAKSPKKLGIKKGKRNDESNVTESPENSNIKINSEVQNNCVVVLHNFKKVSQHTNEKGRNVLDDKHYTEKEDSENKGTDSCDVSAANLHLTSSEELDESHPALLEDEVGNPSKNMLFSIESGFVSPTDTLKGQKTNQNMNIVRANEIIKTGKRITRSKARAVAGLGNNGVPVFDLKATVYKKDNTYFQKCARTSIKKAIKTLASSQKHVDSKENSLVSLSKKHVNHTPLTSKVLSDVTLSSSSLLNTSKKIPLTGPFLNLGSANKLLKSAAKPGVILCNTETFIKKKTVVSENKQEQLKKRQEKENDAQRRREELLKKKIEDQKKKKEKQRLKVLQKREALEKEKLLLQERVEKDREVKQKDNQLKKKLELEKKGGVKRKIEETKCETASAKQKQEEFQHKALDIVPMEMVNHVEKEENAPVSSAKIENKKLTVLLRSKLIPQKNASEACNLNTTWTAPISADLNTTWVKPVIPSVSKTENSSSTVNEVGNNAYFLDDLMSEDSDEENESQSHKKPARWAKSRSRLLHESRLEMHLASKIRKVLACQNQSIKINEMFPNKRLLRTSSAKWDTPPRYSTLPQY